MKNSDKFNLISSISFSLLVICIGVRLLVIGAIPAGIFAVLVGLGMALFIILKTFDFNKMKISDKEKVSSVISDTAIDPYVAAGVYFGDDITHFFSDQDKEDLITGFIEGYNCGLVSDNVDDDCSTVKGFTSEYVAKLGMSYAVGYNLGFIYTMDGKKPDFEIVKYKARDKVELMRPCTCDGRSPIRDFLINDVSSLQGFYECLNCGGHYTF